LENVLSRRDDEGNSLIEFPDNFDEVVDAMKHEDIASDTPWYACLLEQAVAEPTAEATRQKAMERAMAQVRLLDAKLERLSRVSCVLQRPALSGVEAGASFTLCARR
jgi:hypothetical protein